MMKTLLISAMILLSISFYAQSSIEKFEKQCLDLTWQTFKKENNIKNFKKLDGDVKSVTLDASIIDKDYDKITFIFITDKLSHFIIEFNELPTENSLTKKYGEYLKLPYGYHWVNRKNTMDILYHNSYKNEIMVSFININ